MKFRRGFATLVILLAGLTLAGCSAAPSAPAPTTPPAQPAAAKPAATSAPAAAAPAAAAPASWADVFPAGAGKQLTLQNCGTCHGFDRVVLGQKTAERWNSVKADHKDKVSGMSQADMDTLFTYLTQSFGPDKPEPNIEGLPVISSAT